MTSVVSRIGIARTISGSITVATVVPAAVQLAASPRLASAKPSSWLPASPMKTAALLAEPEVERQEADAGEAEREREDERRGRCRVHGGRVDREVGAGDRGERRREAVHVVEQVERVRDPDEPDDGDDERDDVVREQLDAEGRSAITIAGGGELGSELRQRAEVPNASSTSPAAKIRVQPATIPTSSARRLDRADEDGGADPGDEARRRSRRRRRSASAESCQRSPVGTATQPPPETASAAAPG